MRKLISILLVIILFPFIATAQNDPEAIKVLDKFAGNAMKAPSVSMKFRIITNNQPENKIDTAAGSVILSKDKYKLELPDNIVWFDGSTSWSYLQAEQEVTITKPDKKDNTFQSRPSLIFTMYKKDYKCRLVEEKTDSYQVDLYPLDIKSDILRIRLTIGKSQYNLISLEYKRRDGIIATIQVLDYNLKQAQTGDLFIFKAEKYKGAEIIDMR
jgi:outer membrane lipoprotein-sorting protein